MRNKIKLPTKAQTQKHPQNSRIGRSQIIRKPSKKIKIFKRLMSNRATRKKEKTTKEKKKTKTNERRKQPLKTLRNWWKNKGGRGFLEREKSGRCLEPYREGEAFIGVDLRILHRVLLWLVRKIKNKKQKKLLIFS